MLQAALTKALREYIDKRQATGAEWVTLRPIFDACEKETGYEGGGELHAPWWRQEAAEQQLEATLKKNWQQRGSDGDGNPTGVAGVREGKRSQSQVVMGDRREEDGFSVCWDGDGGRPRGRMILCWRWRWQRQSKDDGG